MSLIDQLPKELPIPEDDGGSDHLTGMRIPPIELPSTRGGTVDPSSVLGWLVVYVYPMTGRPDRQLPQGWDSIPGARGCTPQSCAFRDHHGALRALGATVIGISTQDAEYQREMVNRLHLPYDVLSDKDRSFGTAMNLPTMTVCVNPTEDPVLLYKRLTMIVQDGVIKHVMYPVFPPDRNAADVEAWLAGNV